MAYPLSGHPSATGRAQDRGSSPARDRRSTTVPRHQLLLIYIRKKLSKLTAVTAEIKEFLIVSHTA